MICSLKGWAIIKKMVLGILEVFLEEKFSFNPNKNQNKYSDYSSIYSVMFNYILFLLEFQVRNSLLLSFKKYLYGFLILYIYILYWRYCPYYVFLCLFVHSSSDALTHFPILAVCSSPCWI